MLIKNNLNKLTLTALLFCLTANAADDNKIYAVVNGINITKTDISIALKNQRVDFDTLKKEEQKQAIDQVIQKKILSEKALKSDIPNTKVYKDTLNLTIKGLKEELALQIWLQSISKDVTVSKEDAKKYYDDNQKLFMQPLQLNASHILVKTKKEAEKLIKKLSSSKNIKDDFKNLAIKKSTGPSGKNGGNLGWFTLEKMLPNFSKAALALEVGKITKTPVKTQYGYHVIHLNDKKESKSIAFPEVQNKINAILGQNKFKEKLDAIIKKEMSQAKIQYK